MRKKESRVLSIASYALNFIFDSAQMLPMPLEAPYAYLKRIRHLGPGDISHAFFKLKESGVVSVYEKNNQKFIRITNKGQLKVLLEKAALLPQKNWDGKWRLLMFDIPERSREKRNQLRYLLKNMGFYKLQASVFIHPYALNQQAVRFLEDSGLIDFIRILRVDKMDQDKKLLKHFGLKKPG